MSAVSSAEPKGAGVCKVQITVAVQGLRRNTSYPWRVWIRGNPVWKSNPLGDMISNQEGIAVGTATVNVLRVIEALDPDQTAGAIVKKLKEGRDASEVAYRDWVVEVITDKDPPLTRAPQSDEWVWPNAIAGKTFQIDMSITPP